MASLKTGRSYEVVFGPGLNLAPGAVADAISAFFVAIKALDSGAVSLSVASEGLKVIGSNELSAIDAGRSDCAIRCRVYDRNRNVEISTEEELGREGLAPRNWMSPKEKAFDARSAGSQPAKRASKYR